MPAPGVRDGKVAHDGGGEAELPGIDRRGRHRERGGPADELQRIDVQLAKRDLEVGAEEAAVAALVHHGVFFTLINFRNGILARRPDLVGELPELEEPLVGSPARAAHVDHRHALAARPVQISSRLGKDGAALLHRTGLGRDRVARHVEDDYGFAHRESGGV